MNPLGAQLIVSQRMLAFSNAWVVQHLLYLLSIMHYIAQAGQELGTVPGLQTYSAAHGVNTGVRTRFVRVFV